MVGESMTVSMSKTLTEIIQGGEDSAVEFKSAEFRNDTLAKEIVAFSNMSGGSILSALRTMARSAVYH